MPDNQGDAPVNQWSHFTALADTKEGVVVAPNSDTLYSIAWLDLRRQPIILHVPETSRFNVVPLLTPYEENIANIGTDFSGALVPGDYMIAGPITASGYRSTRRRDRHPFAVQPGVADRADGR